MQYEGAREVRVSGSDTRVHSFGPAEAPVILMIHGFRGDHHGLLKIAQNLPGFNVLIPDLPGFGDSSALDSPHTLNALGRWLKELISELGLQNFYLLGHSFGSLVVANSLEQGIKPNKTILINPISQPALEGPKRVLTHAATFYYKLGAVLPEFLADPLLKSPLVVRAMSLAMTKTKDPDLRGWIHNQHDQYFSNFSDRKTLLQAYEASISNTVTAYAESFDMPTLLIVGDRDDITPMTAQLELRNRLPSAQMVTLGGTGHLVHYERASQSASLIADFVKD